MIESTKIVKIDNKVYRVLPINEGIKEGFKKGCAYQMDSTLDQRIYPFITNVKSYDEAVKNGEIGLYYNKAKGNYYIVRPKKKLSYKFEMTNYRDLNEDSIFEDLNFLPDDIDLSVDGELLLPKINQDDDMLNKLFKTAINLIRAPFEAFAKRISASEKGNIKRAIMTHSKLSSNKSVEYGDIFDLEYCLIIRSKPNAVFPMRIGKPIKIYSGDKFDVSEAVDIENIKLRYNEDGDE